MAFVTTIPISINAPISAGRFSVDLVIYNPTKIPIIVTGRENNIAIGSAKDANVAIIIISTMNMDIPIASYSELKDDVWVDEDPWLEIFTLNLFSVVFIKLLMVLFVLCVSPFEISAFILAALIPFW